MDPKDRHALLAEELSKVKLTIRPDSRLCSGFVNDSLGEDWPVDRVVAQCALMHWLYNYTRYPLIIRDATRHYSNFFTGSKDLHLFVRDSVQPHVKYDIYRAHGGIPSQWPWLDAMPFDVT